MGCPHCGLIHNVTCPRIKAIDYYPDGIVKRIEFKDLADTVSMSHYVQITGDGPCPTPAKPNAN